MARYVIHGGKHYEVLAEQDHAIDGLMLKLYRPGCSTIWAMAKECREPKPKRRRFKSDSHVLEVSVDGGMTVRRVRSPKRYAFALADLYDWAVRCAVLKGTRVPKAFRARRKR